jgi:hypothetical protein
VLAGRRSARGAFAILSKWSLPTRLETRTKESKTHASMVVEKPTCVVKAIDAKATAASTDHDILSKGLSKSVLAASFAVGSGVFFHSLQDVFLNQHDTIIYTHIPSNIPGTG